jgi:hypothetical protein
MQIPIVSGIFADTSPDLRTSYPVNQLVVPMSSGASAVYLRPADGIVGNGTGPGTDRGGINWNGVCYRVMGSKLVTVSSTGTVTVLGDVGNDGEQVTLDYSFDLLGIASNGNFFYWDPATNTLTQNTGFSSIVTVPFGPDIIDIVWVDARWMVTDGKYLACTDLNPLTVNSFAFASSEIDPDPIKALLKLRNEIYALNRHTIEVFDNIDSQFFPFARIEGAQIEKGTIGTHTCCVFLESIAFLGSGFNEEPAIYLGGNASTQKISTQDIDKLLASYTEAQLAQCRMEARNYRSHQLLYLHLPDRTIVYDAAASTELKQQVWTVLASTLVGFSQYRAQNLVWCYDKWLVGDPQSSAVGYLVDNIGSHWGSTVRWEFATPIVYNSAKGAVVHELELVALTGSVAVGQNPQISTSYSLDGVAWGQDHFIAVGTIGNRTKRLVWRRQGFMRQRRMQRFRGDSTAHIGAVALEAQIEAMAY